MAMSAVWIRHNMLGSVEQHERQLTEAELRIQRSLQKLSIPDWYLNNQTNPPKILSNNTPIDCRPPSWKNPGPKRISAADSRRTRTPESCCAARNEKSGANINTGTYKICRQIKLSEVNRSPRKSPSKIRKKTGEDLMDTEIPKVKLPTNISKTFPKVSPSRKIQNINIVFPPGPAMDISNISEDESEVVNPQYSTFIVRKELTRCEEPTEKEDTVMDDEDDGSITPTKTYTNYSFHSFSTDSCDLSLKAGNLECSFTVRAVSTPKQGTKAELFSSTVLENTPKIKNLPIETVAERTILEDSLEDSLCSNFSENIVIPEKVSTPENRNIKKLLPVPSYQSPGNTPRVISRANLILANKIRALEPIVFEKIDTKYPSSPRKSCIAVREIAKKFDETNQPRKIQELVSKLKIETASPCTRFFHSKKKSTELESIVQNTQAIRNKGLVRGIIEELSEKSKTSTLRQNRLSLSNQNYVKTVVSALEKGDTLKFKKVLPERRKSVVDDDASSYSESDAKSRISSTTISLKDTDSSSDSEQRSPTIRSDEESRFDYSTLSSRRSALENRAKGCQTDEEDSVYWIPVTRCKLRRTSSLLSIISRPSATGCQSPCVSPIRSESESSDCSPVKPWGATFKKNPVPKKLFRIDETVVTDSGYSDKSNNHNASTYSIADATWSEGMQTDSGSENRCARFKKSSNRRKTMVGLKSVLV